MAKFHKLKVADIKQETADTVSVSFEIPASLTNDFHFIQGQYLTLKQLINDEDVRRSYSLCTSPHDNDLRVAIKQVENGRFSTYANHELKVGDELEVMTPQGSFYTELNSDNSKNYVAFAAGSGITPIMSIMKSVLAQEPNSTFTLFYGNKSTKSIIFRESIDDLKNIYTNRLSVYHLLTEEHPGSDLFYGRINQDKCEVFFEKLVDVSQTDEFFMCGPESMIKEVSGLLEKQGVKKEKIHFELFTSPSDSLQSKATVKASSKANKEDKVNSEITLIMDGEKSTFGLATEGKNILDSALEKGLDVPFACKGAVCCTCRAKVLEGEVKMDLNYSLEKEEVDAGYVLTCQAHPLTEKVTVSFDD